MDLSLVLTLLTFVRQWGQFHRQADQPDCYKFEQSSRQHKLANTRAHVYTIIYDQKSSNTNMRHTVMPTFACNYVDLEVNSHCGPVLCKLQWAGRVTASLHRTPRRPLGLEDPPLPRGLRAAVYRTSSSSFRPLKPLKWNTYICPRKSRLYVNAYGNTSTPVLGVSVCQSE